MINILLSNEFNASKIDTNFISKKFKDGFKGSPKDENILDIMAIAALSKKIKYLKEVNQNLNNISKNWIIVLEKKVLRFSILSIKELSLILIKNNKKFFIEFFMETSSFTNKIKINDNFYNLRIISSETVYNLYYKGYSSEVSVLRDLEYESYKNLPKRTLRSENNFLLSPMPGKVVNILIKEGDIVKAGDTLIVLDAMKMENILKSESKVKVIEVFVKKDDAVSADQKLIKLLPVK